MMECWQACKKMENLDLQILRHFSNNHVSIRNPTYLDFFTEITAFIILIIFIQGTCEKIYFCKNGPKFCRLAKK